MASSAAEPPAGMLDGAKRYLMDFASLPTQVYWVLVLEILNSFRSGGLRSIQYSYLANEWGLCDDELTGLPIEDCVIVGVPVSNDDEATGALLGLSGSVSVVAGVVGSMVTDAIGVRRTALIALSIALVGRSLWTFGHSHFQLYLAVFFFSPFGDAMLSAGLYTVALKKLTPPKLRPFAFSVQYSLFNMAFTISYWMIGIFRKKEDRIMFGMTFSGVRMFLFTTWIAIAVALVIVICFLQDHTVIDKDDPDAESEGIVMPTEDINGVPLSEDVPMPPGAETATGFMGWRARATRKYRVVHTPMISAGAVGKLQALAAEQGYPAAVKSAVNSFGTQMKLVWGTRNLWMVMFFSLCTLMVSKQWGDMDQMMPPQITRMYGYDTWIDPFNVSSLNTIGCLAFAAVVAAFTGPKEAFSVIMPGLWVMACAPIFLALDPTINSAILWICVLTLGELMWSPRQTAWAATLAPTGREGVFIALAKMKDLIVTPFSSWLNGYMNGEYVPNCYDCRSGEMFCGAQFKNDTMIGCKGPGDAGEFCENMRWEMLDPLDSASKAKSPDWCDAIKTCYQCQPEVLMPGAELKEMGWDEDARANWFLVMFLSFSSPVMAWLALPFLRGDGTRENYYGIFECGPARLLGMCGCGAPDKESAKAGESLMGSDSLQGGSDGFTLGGEEPSQAPPSVPSVGPEGGFSTEPSQGPP